MTLLSFGLAEECAETQHRGDATGPTIIESQASINWGMGTPAMWRKADILVDCVRRLVAKPPADLTGQALIDEDFLRGEGVTDFSPYACVPGSEPARLSWESLK